MVSVIEAQRNACYAAVDAHVSKDTNVIGIGSGTTIVHCVDRLRQHVSAGWQPEACIATSHQTKKLIIDAGLPLRDFDQYPWIDVAFDGADTVYPNTDCIKGGGGCLLREKVIASAAKRVVIVADFRKLKRNVPVPIEILPDVSERILQVVERSNLKGTLRTCTEGKIGPVVTENGNYVVDVDVDVDFATNTEFDLDKLDRAFITIPGILETGIFSHGIVDAIYVGNENGQVDVLTRQK